MKCYDLSKVKYCCNLLINNYLWSILATSIKIEALGNINGSSDEKKIAMFPIP